MLKKIYYIKILIKKEKYSFLKIFSMLNFFEDILIDKAHKNDNFPLSYNPEKLRSHRFSFFDMNLVQVEELLSHENILDDIELHFNSASN